MIIPKNVAYHSAFDIRDGSKESKKIVLSGVMGYSSTEEPFKMMHIEYQHNINISTITAWL
jgi:hypothetical protein